MSASTKILLETANHSTSLIQRCRAIIPEYAASLDIDLSFQGFEKELASLSQQYGKPTGALVLTYFGWSSGNAGCTGVKPAELKRMYMYNLFRVSKLGNNYWL